MDSYEFSDSDLELVRLLRESAAADELVSEVRGGFSPERAALFLESPEKFAELADLVSNLAPGAGWFLASATRSERGRLNLRLLDRVLRLRPTPDDHRFRIERRNGTTRLTVKTSPDEPASGAEIRLPAGRAIWSSTDLDAPPEIEFSGQTPVWLADLIGEASAEAVASGADAVDVDEGPEISVLSRYALGLWLHRWHPGGTSEQASPFDESLLRVELGALASQAAPSSGASDQAAEWLNGTGLHILALADRIQSWTGWRRVLADSVLTAASRAYAAAFPRAPETEMIRALSQALERGDAEAAELADEFAEFATQDLPEPKQAMLAGQPGQSRVSGVTTVDPLLVPPRSVSALAPNVIWELVDQDGVTGLQVTVAPGDTPVSCLEATVMFDDQSQTIRLPHEAAGYRGILETPAEPPDTEVYVHDVGVPGPFRGPEAVQATRAWIEALLEARRDVLGSVEVDDGLALVDPERPFLAELVDWRAWL